MNNNIEDRPNTIAWPPVIYLGAIAAGLLVHWASPWRLEPGLPWRLAGAAIMVLVLALDIWSITTLMRHHTNVRPDRRAESLVTSGPYAWSRNPIYLGNTLAVLGAALAFDRPWLIVAAIAATIAIVPLAIWREERHLEARFGESWRAYASRVRRWI